MGRITALDVRNKESNCLCMNIPLESLWKELLETESRKPYFIELTKKVCERYETSTVFPPPEKIFNAFSLCSFASVRVVILGQDPYHCAGQAQGLSFSVPDGIKIPPSLKNIYKEIATDLEKPIPLSGNLERWATQGILLLNTALTVESGQPGSHKNIDWETFTDTVIEKISTEKKQVVFLLWGKHAHTKASLIDDTKHLVLMAPHPSPLSAYTGFFGCQHFSQTNVYLRKHNLSTIDW